MSDFQYSYRAYDLPESKQESDDLIDARDKQLENYLKNNNGLFFPNRLIKYGTIVTTLPGVDNFLTITYATAFPSTVVDVAVLVSNGDYGANTARIESQVISGNRLTSFRAYHARSARTIGTSDVSLDTGIVGGGVRINYIAIGIE